MANANWNDTVDILWAISIANGHFFFKDHSLGKMYETYIQKSFAQDDEIYMTT